MNKVVLITGASSGFGRLAAKALGRAGHVVYGSMRQTATRNAPVVEQMANFSQDNTSTCAHSNSTYNRKDQSTLRSGK